MNPGPTCAMSVVIPVFNRLSLLVETVGSLSAQTLSDVEFILVDDRSNETVRDYLRELCAGDSRFHLIDKPAHVPRGCQLSRNIGLDACAGEAVVFLDSDDLLSPSCLEQRHSFLQANRDADIAVAAQAIFRSDGREMEWVNVARADVSDLDRFLALTHPLDVPWVNGGVAIRMSALRKAGIRWRPEFHWDDVAFHFECLALGLKAQWMPRLSPDSFYRSHSLDRYGEALLSESGLRSSTHMMVWMLGMLASAGKLTGARREQLAVDFYHACFLRAVDMEAQSLAVALVAIARNGGLLTASDVRRLQAYATGRRALRAFPRFTFYWNRLSEARYLAAFEGNGVGTFGSQGVA